MSKQNGILWIPRSLIIFISIILLIVSILLSNFKDESISILININLVIITTFFILSFYWAQVSGILYFVYAFIMVACTFKSYDFAVVIPMVFILISSILLFALPEDPKNLTELSLKRVRIKLHIPKWMKHGSAWLLLICILFLLLVHLTVKTDQKIPNEVILPKHNRLYSMFILEDPNHSLDQMQVNFRRYYLLLYQVDLEPLTQDIKKYLNKRNTYIRSFEKKFVDPVYVKSDNPFQAPFQKIQRITEFLPIMTGNLEGILLITRDWNSSLAQKSFSDVYYLDSTFRLLDHITLNSLHEEASAYVSTKFMNRVWLPTVSLDNSDPKSLKNSIISRHLISIQVIDGKIVTKESVGKYLYAFSDEHEISSNFDQYRFINISTNPTLTIYKEPTLNKFLIPVKGFTTSLVNTLNKLTHKFPYLYPSLIVLMFLLMILFRKQIASYFRNLRKKRENDKKS